MGAHLPNQCPRNVLVLPFQLPEDEFLKQHGEKQKTTILSVT